MKFIHAFVALFLVLPSVVHAAVIDWVGTQSGQIAVNDRASFHDAENWFNFVTPGPNDSANLGSGFDPQGTNTFPHHIYFGRFQTQYHPPSPGGDAPPIPAQDRTIFQLHIQSGNDWVFDFGTNISEPFAGQTHGSLTTTNGIFLASTNVPEQMGESATLLVTGGKLSSPFPMHLAGFDSNTATLRIVGNNAEVDVAYVDLGLSGEGTILLEEGASLKASSSFGPLWIGIFDGGRGHLVATGGSSVVGGGALGREIGSFGSATISDGSTWTMDPDRGIAVGYLGSGKLEIRSGGYVDGRANIGVGALSDSSATVTGNGSKWNVHELFGIGREGKGALEILDKGHVISEDASMGFLVGTFGRARVDNALWEIKGNEAAGRPGSLMVGIEGTAELNVESVGVVTVRRELRIGGLGTVDVSRSGIINVGDGDLPERGILRIGPTGILSGRGTVIGNVLVDGGTIAPGTSPGALHINGNFHQSASGLLALEIGGTTPATQYDQLLVTGNLLLEGTVQIQFIDGFVPQPGDTFNLLSGASAALSGPLAFVNAPPNFQYATSLSSGQFSLTVVPEPSSLLMVCMAFITMYAAARRANYQNA